MAKNYLQHIMDVLISSFGITYDFLENIYNEFYIEKYNNALEEEMKRKALYEAQGKVFRSKAKLKTVSSESIKDAHKKSNRGNLPSKMTAKEFYDEVIGTLPMSEIKSFACCLCEALEEAKKFPEEWLAYSKYIDGLNPSFNPDLFSHFIIALLTIDKTALPSPPSKSALSLIPEEKKAVEKVAEVKNVPELSPLTFSSRFFTSGARSLISVPDEEFRESSKKLSEVFKNIINIDLKVKNAESVDTSQDVIDNLQKWVGEAVRNARQKNVLKIEGPLGCYKNRLIQYLYIALERFEKHIIPIYIDVAAYEKSAEDDKHLDENDFYKFFEKDIQIAEELFMKEPHRTPLLLIDGIRDFYCKKESLYNYISTLLKKYNRHLIVCIDTDFTVNGRNKINIHPLTSKVFGCSLKIRSMNLNRKEESLDFIRSCIDVFNVTLPSGVAAEKIYKNLVRLDFLSIDAYWLTHILHSHLDAIIDKKNDISELYDALSLSFLGSHSRCESAAEIAYNFEFGDGAPEDVNPYYDLRWRLIRKHRSVLDYLIAKYYEKKFSELKIFSDTKEKSIEKLKFFNMVLPKNFTRFVMRMLTKLDEYEMQIMKIAEDYYDDLKFFGKSELTFWMGRLENSTRQQQCIELLHRYHKKELARYKEDNFSSLEEKRKAAFLLRGISVSLIYENDDEALEYYMNSLLTDKIANSVNRGFHLEYYGDKPYIPNTSLLDFEDDVTVGENTLTVLCLSLEEKISKKRRYTQYSAREDKQHIAILEIMTICSLIQARIEFSKSADAMDITPYVDKCIKYLDWILYRFPEDTLKDVFAYFKWMHKQLTEYKSRCARERKCVKYNQASIFNTFSEAVNIDRSGWVNADIKNPENIVEHMYNCWLMGMLYLPEACDDPDYDKNSILQMLLLHDLGEAVTGDISRPEKLGNQSYFDEEERKVMHSLLLSGTYPHSVNLSEYLGLWNTWDSGKSINARIAKDIDNIQAVYQFCNYYIKSPQNFSNEDIYYWVSGIEDVKTAIGDNIVSVLLFDNPLYSEIMKIYFSEDTF